jgi:hypothetical protein
MAVQESEQIYAYDPDLKCSWLSWRVIDRGWLSVHVPADHCTDIAVTMPAGSPIVADGRTGGG